MFHVLSSHRRLVATVWDSIATEHFHPHRKFCWTVLLYNVLCVVCMSYFFSERGYVAFIRLSKAFLTSSRLTRTQCLQVFCDLQGIMQIKGVVFIQKTPGVLHVSFFFLLIS